MIVEEEVVDGAVLDDIAHRLRGSGALVLSGAGLSTDSGIPDYRGPDGTRRVQPMQYAEFTGSSTARQRYWARSYAGWERFVAARPNGGHRAVTDLQRAGAIAGIITQNVDGLHTAAGAAGVVELHGSLAKVVCLACRAEVPRPVIQAELAAENPDFLTRIGAAAPDGSRVSSQIRPDGDLDLPADAVAGFHAPVCRSCGADLLKPDVVFFGESVPKDRVDRSYALTDAAPLLLVLGSSLAVMSGLRFVRRAAKNGTPIAIITRSPTRGDDLATWKIEASVSPTLRRLVDLLS